MTEPATGDVTIRRATEADAPAVGDVWLASWRATFDFAPGHPDDAVRTWLAQELIPSTEAWVALDPAGRVVGLMALSEAMVDQLYLAPDWIGRGLGARLLDLAKAQRPGGLDLYCFQVNGRARRFYERHGFAAIAFGDGSGNEEHQPDIRYAWRPMVLVRSVDGTPIARFDEGEGPPLVLVHGAAADHTTFRVVGPRLASRFRVHAIDRRGRGASGDALPYGIEREFEDVAAVAEALADETGRQVAVFGHSWGGRCALGAALRTSAIERVISYEGAPPPGSMRYQESDLVDRLAALGAAGRPDELLATFLREVVGMTPDELTRYQAEPVWPRRVEAAPTIVRELRAETDPGAGLEVLGAVRQPVLQLLGGESRPVFGEATRGLDRRLADGRIVKIPGAKHAAHHTHPDAVIEAVTTFLGV
jgi:pimeloyl-ACP methyl ester carboxylesterase/GNAT superfamily N-acetyltransferase